MIGKISRRMLGIAAAVCLAQAPGAAAPGPAPREVVSLAEGWQFKLGPDGGSQADDGWQKVSVPHTWNRVGYYLNDPASHINRAENVEKTRGIGWYRLAFKAPKGSVAKRYWLQFDAASRTPEVWLNGAKLGEHKGGFSRFRFDATNLIKPGQENQLQVKVDNAQPSADAPASATFPLTGDFFVHGGLYRPVSLIVTDQVHIDMLDYGGPGVYASTTSIAGSTAQLGVRSRLGNDGEHPATLRLVTRLIDKAGKSVAQDEQRITLDPNAATESAQQLRVPRARLWQGTADPYRNCPERICVWSNVRLAVGSNQIVASGKFGRSTVSDRIAWNLAAPSANSFRIDSGAVVAAAGPVRFGSDAFFEGGTAGTADTPGGRGRAPVIVPIQQATNRDITASFREGDFHYRLPLVPGRYSVLLTFVEPKAAPGTRRFQVLANGQAALRDFDVAEAAGGTLIEVRRSFEAVASKQGLDLHFKPGSGSALVSGVEVTPLP